MQVQVCLSGVTVEDQVYGLLVIISYTGFVLNLEPGPSYRGPHPVSVVYVVYDAICRLLRNNT